MYYALLFAAEPRMKQKVRGIVDVVTTVVCSMRKQSKEKDEGKELFQSFSNTAVARLLLFALSLYVL